MSAGFTTETVHDRPWVSASEMGDYVFCKRGWWLRFTGVIRGQTAEMVEGTVEHEKIAARSDLNEQGFRVGWLLVAIGIALLVIITLVTLLLS